MTDAHDHWKNEVLKQSILLAEQEVCCSLASSHRSKGLLETTALRLAHGRGHTKEHVLREMERMDAGHLAALISRESLWVYFDDYDKQGERLRVTNTLLKASKPASCLYCANPDVKIYRHLKALKVNALKRTIEDSLASQTWSGAIFSVAYLDTCYGKWQSVFNIIRKLLKQRMLMHGAIVVVTLTRRGGEGQALSERMADLASKVVVLGLEVLENLGTLQEIHGPAHVKFFRLTTDVA